MKRFVKAERAAEQFIEFCTGRAWVFTDTGTTKEGERLFQFTHRTFLEYFTASYLVSIHPTPVGLLDALLQRILRREWDVVSQLAFQIQSKQVHGASDVLLTGLLELKKVSDDERGNALSFAERTLEFLVPSPTVRRELTRAAMEFWLGETIRTGLHKVTATSEESCVQHVGNLLVATSENRETITAEIEGFLSGWISSGDPAKASVCSEMALELAHPLVCARCSVRYALLHSARSTIFLLLTAFFPR